VNVLLPVRDDGLLQLAHTCVHIGATFGRVNVENIWYGRQSIRNECELKFHQYREDIKSIIQPYINDRTVSATVDLWRDDIIQRYYLDFTIFYMTEHWQLKHGILRCKYFDEQSKSAINIWSEIESIFDEFHLVIGDTPITTDEGANIKASLKNEIRCPCMAHRCSTTLECAWDKTNQLSFDFRCLTGSVSELRSFVARSGGLQAKLPKTVKKDSCTRPWRSYYIVYESVYSSYDSLIKLLEPMFEENKILSINQNLLKNIVDLMKRFSGIFDQLEFCNQPTLQNVVPSYYAMVDFVRLNSHDRPEIKILKEQIQIALESKYWTSIMQIHWIATFLDPSFRDLSFVNDKAYRLKQIKCIENGLYSMADDLKLEDVRKDNNTSESSKNERISGFDDHDPFSNFRTQKRLTTHDSIQELLAAELIDYKTISAYAGDQRQQILTFWKHNERRLPVLSIIAKRILVIQASSAESERHFSAGGAIVNEKRGLLSESSVETLIVLREAYLNDM
ncbi:unnamed protein product, partial [Rotaria sordida]